MTTNESYVARLRDWPPLPVCWDQPLGPIIRPQSTYPLRSMELSITHSDQVHEVLKIVRWTIDWRMRRKVWAADVSPKRRGLLMKPSTLALYDTHNRERAQE